MLYSVRDLQARLAALGCNPGLSGRRTRLASDLAMADRNVISEADLFHPSGLHRIHMHWTAGAEGVIELEREHYHFVIDSHGVVVKGL